jgi:hypothetical protein
LSAAGVEAQKIEPQGVREIVDLCGRLPLALGIAGRLAVSLGLVGTQDWSDMIGVLKEELRESHSGGVEEGMIRASLRGLKGSATEQANVKSLLLLFALVPEDTRCPLEVLLLMFTAVHNESGATMMHIRKWLRILINRSLVLGTVDAPSVHDLVLDFAIAQHGDDVLRADHRLIVEAFRAARPADAHGRLKFDRTSRDDPMAMYVCAESAFHLRHGWEADMEHDSDALANWLGDVPQDEIVLHAGQVLGTDRLSSLTRRAEDRGDWWLAGRYWAILCILKNRFTPGTGQAEALKSVDIIAKFCRENANGLLEDQACTVQLEMLRYLALGLDPTLFVSRSEIVEQVLSSKAGVYEPISAALVRAMLSFPLALSGDCVGFGRVIYAFGKGLAVAAKTNPDINTRYKCTSQLTIVPWFCL